MTATTATSHSSSGTAWAHAQIYRNPYVLEQPLVSGFRFLKNPLIARAERVVNPLQAQVFAHIGTSADFSQLLGATAIAPFQLIQILDRLEVGQFVSVASSFAPPLPSHSRGTLSLWVHTSNRCNLACSYCYVNAEPNGGLLYDTAFHDLETHLRRLADFGDLRHVQLKLAGGEPLATFSLWSYAVEQLKADLESRGIRVTLQVLTNGTLLTRQILQFLMRNKVGVGLSLDGHGAFHDRTRHFHSGRGSFDIVARNLRRLKDANIEPYVTTVVVPESLPGLPALTTFLIEEDLRFRFSLAKGCSFDVGAATTSLLACYAAVESALPRYRHFLSHTLCDLSFGRPVADSPCGVGRSHGSMKINAQLHA